MKLTAVDGDGKSSAPTVVETLEELLVQAKRGDITQIALAYETSDGSVGNQFAAGPRQSLSTLIGAVSILQAHMYDWWKRQT